MMERRRKKEGETGGKGRGERGRNSRYFTSSWLSLDPPLGGILKSTLVGQRACYVTDAVHEAGRVVIKHEVQWGVTGCSGV